MGRHAQEDAVRPGDQASRPEPGHRRIRGWTPASAIRFFANKDPVAQHLSFAVTVHEDRLVSINPPAAKPCFGPEYPDSGTPVVWILVSDASLALITGKRRTLKKYDI